ncbi:MAG: haloacid dehalogenase-like hydrolase [Thermoanaerobaculia bacterium]|jgi:phosphoglycolate phosphatase-like HAD superfamily hydrolase
MPRLILFDIDGTILRDDGMAREAYGIALREIYGHERSLRPYDFSGLTDPQITRIVLGDAGYGDDVISEKLDALWEVYLREMRARVSAERVRLMPGVVALIEILEREPEVTLALLTGNIEPGARIKLGAHELNGCFPFGAFGSDSAVRAELPPVAIRRAEEVTGLRFAPSDVVIIGDSIHDVRCAVPHGATSIAVPTGPTRAEALLAEGPTYFFETLEPGGELLAAILGR